MAFVNKIPVLGYVKGVVQIAIGDEEEGITAIKQSTRSTVVLGAGAVGILGGPAGAIAAGAGAGAAWDCVESACADEPRGVVKHFNNAANAARKGDGHTYVKEYTKLVFSVAADGQMGWAGGQASCLLEPSVYS